MSGYTQAELRRWNSGYAIKQEDRKALRASLQQMPYTSRDMRLPENFDPRTDKKFAEGWLRVENQGPVGACFLPGVLITMADGSQKPIEDVEYGDMVLSHTGKSRQVIDTMRRQYDGDLVEVFIKGWGRIKMTSDHVVPVRRDGDMVWVHAKDIEPTDCMLVSGGVEESPSKLIDVSDYVSGNVWEDADGRIRHQQAKHSLPRMIEIDELACWAMGLYVAEGSSDFTGAGEFNRAIWTIHQEETEYADRLAEWATRLGVPCDVQIRPKSKAMQVRISCGVLASFLSTACGRFCNKKKVPAFILCGSPSQKRAFAKGYLDGDGSDTKSCRITEGAVGTRVSRQVHAATASRGLAIQFAQLLVSIGCKPGRTLTKARGHQNFDSHQIYLYSADVELFYPSGNQHRNGPRSLGQCEFGQWRKIREISTEAIRGEMVYDFTVDEDHSFVADGIAVHNCQGYSLSENAEFCFAVETGKIRQFCPMVAYVVSQRFDGINGDRGSTLSGGTKCAAQFGFCEQGRGLPEHRYPSGGPRAVTSSMERNAADNKIKSAVDIRDPEKAKAFIGTYQGLGQFGTKWTEGLANPSASGVIKSVGGRNYGGHAYTLCGYLSIDSVSDAIKRDLPRTRHDWIWLVKNSHSTRYGDKGFAYMTVELYESLMRDNWSELVGRSDLETIEPRRSKIDFTKTTWFG